MGSYVAYLRILPAGLSYEEVSIGTCRHQA